MEKFEKWADSWEKNFDSSLKAVNRFKDDVKTKPELPEIVRNKYLLYLDLLSAEIADIRHRFTME